MNALLALAAGISLAANDDMHLSYSEFSEIFPPTTIVEEPQASDDDFIRALYTPFNEHLYNASYELDSLDVNLGYSIGIGKFGNLISGELLNLTMLRASMVSEHAKLHLEYSVNTSEFSGDFLEGLFTIKNVLGFSAEFPVCGFSPEIYANLRTRHLLSAGNEEIEMRAGLRAEYSFLRHFSVSAFYEHEWDIGGNPSDIDRGGLGFVFSY